MLTKIIFTLFVIVVVALVFRTKSESKKPAVKTVNEEQGSLSTRTVTYGILGLLVVISVVLFVFDYKSDNTIVNIRVISEDGSGTTYQAKQKSIKGRNFVTLDGKQVTLGESDRIEME